MPSFPQTLVQIHYHDRPCGVMRVMRAYAAAFRSAGKNGKSWLIGAHDKEACYPEFPAGAIFNLPDADYREFKSKRDFVRARDLLMARIADFLISSAIEKPVAVAGHNLTLCKNAALVSAFAGLSRSVLLWKNGCRFYSVAHDLAEEGRVNQISSIHRLERMGIPIARDLRMAEGAVRHVTVNKKVFGIFRQAGLPVSFLGNPVVAEKCGARNGSGHLAGYCHSNRIPFDASLPVYAYPARTIARKNPLEAVLLACVLLKGKLLLGPAGRSARDRRMHDAIKTLAQKQHLPVITDMQKIFRNSTVAEIMPAVYAESDAVLTTSVAEGFGYLLYEPFLYRKPVLGRRPSGFRYASAMRNPLLYDCLPVPLQWISGRRIRQVSGITFADFALLDDASQQAIIKKVLASRVILEEWLRLLEKPRAGWPGLPALRRGCPASLISRNRMVVQKQFSMQRFTREFKKCFSIIPTPIPSRINESLFLKSFHDPRTFRTR